MPVSRGQLQVARSYAISVRDRFVSVVVSGNRDHLSAMWAFGSGPARYPSHDRTVGGHRRRPTSVSGSAEVVGVPIRGSAAEIADELLAFHAGGFDHLEIVPWPPTLAALDAMAPVLDRLAG